VIQLETGLPLTCYETAVDGSGVDEKTLACRIQR